MKTAFVYAGQGSQKEGMGSDLYNKYETFKNAFDSVDYDGGKLKNLCFHGSEAELADTRNTQPAMVAFAYAMTQLLKSCNITPSMVAGLSLGEYSALSAAGAMKGETAVRLAAFRGNAMADAVMGLHSKMVAVLKLDREKLRQICREASRYGVVEIANYNCPGQLVIAGEAEAVDKASEMCMSEGAKRCIPLNVSGPFHTSLLKIAGDKLAEKFKSMEFREMNIPVVFNVTGRTIGSGETIKELLERQVQSSVYFEDSVRYMIGCGIDNIIEIGPGKVLSGFIKKIDPSVNTFAVENCEDFEDLKDRWGEINGK
ncbi:[Acyl-carrier-protein] S-malonyltransferase [Hathewaya proteolytica DSM 3090]|uniref:Malonyl CoA-acyl carrier protein transacylase n=1 Tax=Hathewaya proteolytica DSM 3090 TaxID=1121331 RepID=A0A1M6M216_9CLOT|nr:ACP S-malonyltransferase [Hathewaya proteolytica]SHJ77430.1 [Acyl-carrier-protein] S-malonyltransferase [Hathewaya proteolytica DSM 3090]